MESRSGSKLAPFRDGVAPWHAALSEVQAAPGVALLSSRWCLPRQSSAEDQYAWRNTHPLQRRRDALEPFAQISHLSRSSAVAPRSPRLTSLGANQLISNISVLALEGRQLCSERSQRLLQLAFEVRPDPQRIVEGAPTHIGECPANGGDRGHCRLDRAPQLCQSASQVADRLIFNAGVSSAMTWS